MRRDIVITFMCRVLQLALGVAISIVVARNLGPEGQGAYAVGIALAATIVQFAIMGLHSSNTYQLSRDVTLLSPLTANSFWASLLVGTGCAAAIALACQLSRQSFGLETLCLWLAVALVPARMFHLLGIHLLLGLRKFNAYNLLQIFPLLVVIAGFALVTVCHGSLAGFLAATSIGWAIGAAVVLAVLCNLSGLVTHVRFDVLLDGCRYALKAHAACLLAFVVQRANVFLLQVNCGEWEVGQYSIAALICDSLLMLPASVGLVLLPSLVRSADRRWEITRRNLWHVAPIMLAVCAGVGLLAGPLIPLAFGVEYRPAIGILWCLLPATFFLGLTTVASQYLAALGFPKQLVGVWAIALAIVMILNLQLIPRYAAHGAALSLSITSALTFGMVLALIRWHPQETPVSFSPGHSWS